MRILIVAFLVASLVSCMGYAAQITGRHRAITGDWTLIKASPRAVQEVWESRRPDKHRPTYVEAFFDDERKEIWYVSDRALMEELKAVSSYKAMREKALGDEAAWIEGGGWNGLWLW